MPTQHWQRIGLELEGGWRSKPMGLRHDGSVTIRDAEYVGEAGSPPYSKLDNAEKWMRLNYPTHINASCGFHIHVSFGPPDKGSAPYSRLMSREFFDAYLAAYEAWYQQTFPTADDRRTQNAMRFVDRFGGNNRYCLREFRPDTQVENPGNRESEAYSSRYSMLNYCWRHHGTLESRLLPMFDSAEVSISAMKVFLNTIDTWLETAMAQPEPQLEDATEVEVEPERIIMPEFDPEPVLAHDSWFGSVNQVVEEESVANMWRYVNTMATGFR